MADKETKEAHETLEKALATVMSFPEGIAALRYIFFLSGYSENLMRFNPQTFDVNANASIYHLGKRDLWLNLRQHMRADDLAKIECVEATKLEIAEKVDDEEEALDA